MLARYAAEAVAARPDRVAAKVYRDVVPVREGLRNLAMRRLVGRAKILECRV